MAASYCIIRSIARSILMTEKLSDIKDDFPDLVKDVTKLCSILIGASVSFHLNKGKDQFSVLHWTGVIVQSYLQSMFQELKAMGAYLQDKDKNDKYLNKIIALEASIIEVTKKFCDFSDVFEDKKVH